MSYLIHYHYITNLIESASPTIAEIDHRALEASPRNGAPLGSHDELLGFCANPGWISPARRRGGRFLKDPWNILESAMGFEQRQFWWITYDYIDQCIDQCI